MAKRIYTDEQRKERKREASRQYAAKKRLDPAVKENQNAKQKAKYHEKLKNDPLWVEKTNKRVLSEYHEKIKPNAEAMQERRQRIKGYQQKRRERFVLIKLELQKILGSKCVDCGITDHRLLDFDHIDPMTKRMMISQKLHLGVDALLLEVNKCELRCPNCHRLKTLLNKEHDAYRHREYRNKQRSYFKSLPEFTS